MSYLISTKNLSHRFSTGDVVLNNIELEVPKGAIYGFLGPNGAGKTTTLKLILGLLKLQEGEILIFDQALSAHRSAILKRVGSLIEAPSLYGHLTAKENLEIWQKIYQCPKARMQEVLKIVGLDKTGKKKASKFSLGMKQRLSIAVALLHQPELLILDEPTNGLDPAGIMEIRELLQKINQEQGVTVLISSHILAEIEKIASHVGIIHGGKLLFQGTLAELHLQQQSNAQLLIETNNPAGAKAIIEQEGISVKIEQNVISCPVMEKEKMAELNQKLVENGIKVYQFHIQKNNLEEIFMDLTK